MYRSPRLITGSFSRRAFLQRPLRSNITSTGQRAASSSAPAAASSSNFGALAGMAAVSGIAGYYLATQSGSGKPSYDALATPKYASKAEIQQAVKELEGQFPAGGVSTDPDVLKLH